MDVSFIPSLETHAIMLSQDFENGSTALSSGPSATSPLVVPVPVPMPIGDASAFGGLLNMNQ